MVNVGKVVVGMTPEMAVTVRNAVETGEYASSEDVVLEAVRDWIIRRYARDLAIPKLRRLWAEGLASGPAVDGEEAFDRIQKLLDSGVAPRGS